MDRKLRYASLIGLAILFFLCFRMTELEAWAGVAALTTLKVILFVAFVTLTYLEVLERRGGT